jgi:hydroxyethylthiazole kinase
MLFSAAVIETVADFLAEHPVPLVVDPVMVASSGARLLQEDAVEALVSRLFPLATVVTPNEVEARVLVGDGPKRELAERLVELGAPAAIVTGGHGEPVDHIFDGECHVEIPVERHRVRATHGAGCTHSATLAALLARGLSLEEAARGAAAAASRRGRAGASRDRRGRRPGRRARPEGRGVNAGADLALIRERKPLVHQITNYVVMNETANATLALGALPVMAHALQEVEEMARAASALVLNIGTLSDDWVESMVLAGLAANRAGVPVVLDPVGAGATTYRTDTSRRLLAELRIAVVRGNSAEIATLAGKQAQIRGVEAVGEAGGPELAREAARELGAVVAVTGPVDHVSDGATVHAVANGHELLGTVTGTGCMATAITGCFLGVRSDDPLAAAAEALIAFGVAGEEAAKKAKGPGSFHVALYDALYDLDPKKLDSRAKVS